MTTSPARARFSIERAYATSIDDAWALWTTKDGIESWWGPEWFDVTVSSLDLRPGGELVYQMTATGPQQIAFMKQAGMPCHHAVPGHLHGSVAARSVGVQNVDRFCA
ncbi:SRPBCC family protein [Mesorhizobium loti]|uniref:SRPBCC family protein n=1 Tax=Rhizobium loti TaxID=381 RepID=UPI000686DCEE|nr:SRPBCC domain-containing protein [Mesorhizobium loti]